MLGKFEILTSIGSGGYSHVYFAIDSESNKEVALKVLHTKIFKECEFQYLRNEITAMQMLNHKHIIKLDSVRRDTHRTALIMEYASNGDVSGYAIKDILRIQGILAPGWLTDLARSHRNHSSEIKP